MLPSGASDVSCEHLFKLYSFKISYFLRPQAQRDLDPPTHESWHEWVGMCACAHFVPRYTGMCACRPENSHWQCSSGVVNLTPCHWSDYRAGYLGNESQEWLHLFLPRTGLTNAYHVPGILFKYGLWGLNLDPHACKARQALYWVITPVPESQNVISISSAYFVSPRGCTDGVVLRSSQKKKKVQECRNRK